jgi:hypothetical protein
MFGKAAILGALIVALYTGKSWKVFFLCLAAGVAHFVVTFTVHRRKWAKLVCPKLPDC